MGRPSLTKNDWINAGRKRGLTLLTNNTPDSVFGKADWQCDNCGKVMTKSYRAVSLRDNGCRCQNELDKKPDDYHKLAIKRNIRWIKPEKFPQNTKVVTTWETYDGRRFEASYYQLAYPGKMPKAVQELLNG